MECADIMMNHHFVTTCYENDFTYAINSFLIVDVDWNLFIVSNYSKKLEIFF